MGRWSRRKICATLRSALPSCLLEVSSASCHCCAGEVSKDTINFCAKAEVSNSKVVSAVR